MTESKWKMESGNGTKRGACLGCKDESTVDEVLVSVCVNGTSQCYCTPCSNKPKIHRYKQGN